MKKENKQIILWAVIALAVGVIIGSLIANLSVTGNAKRIIAEKNKKVTNNDDFSTSGTPLKSGDALYINTPDGLTKVLEVNNNIVQLEDNFVFEKNSNGEVSIKQDTTGGGGGGYPIQIECKCSNIGGNQGYSDDCTKHCEFWFHPYGTYGTCDVICRCLWCSLYVKLTDNYYADLVVTQMPKPKTK